MGTISVGNKNMNMGKDMESWADIHRMTEPLAASSLSPPSSSSFCDTTSTDTILYIPEYVIGYVSIAQRALQKCLQAANTSATKTSTSRISSASKNETFDSTTAGGPIIIVDRL